MDGDYDVELRPEGGSLTTIEDGRMSQVGGVAECRKLCERIERHWLALGVKGVRCVPVLKEYRGRRRTGEKFVARYWEVSSVGIPTTGRVA